MPLAKAISPPPRPRAHCTRMSCPALSAALPWRPVRRSKAQALMAWSCMQPTAICSTSSSRPVPICARTTTAAALKTGRAWCWNACAPWPMKLVAARSVSASRRSRRPMTLDADPQPLFEYLVRQLAPLGLAYIHVIEGATGGPRELPERPFNYHALGGLPRSRRQGCVDGQQRL